MNISIFGLGYVGAVSLACLARDGHQVVGVDIDQTKLDLIASGKPPIVEEGIQETMATAVNSGRVTVTTNCTEAISATQMSFVCVGTPSRKNGDQDLGAIERLSAEIGEGLKQKSGFHTVVIRSTVRPGTVMKTIEPLIEKHSGKRSGEEFGLCFQPEFLREGSSIRDYDNPPMTIVGCNNETSARLLEDLFGQLPCKFISTDIGTAECLKYACNAFHALKITFANEIGRVTQSLDVDSRKVMELVCEDRQLNISTAYLRPGFAFGGSCLPKDLRALLHVARENDVELPMLAGMLPSNETHIRHTLDMVLAQNTRSVGMIGLSFKSGTDDLRESPLLTMAESLIGKGMQLRIYDPEVNLARLMGANKRYLEESIPHIAELMCASSAEVMAHGDVIIVGLGGQEILDEVKNRARENQYVIDLVGMKDVEQLPCGYSGVCW
ncbi:MAG: UDP-glucose/GDP-mannose dehydrogenase family protein [Gammaproteobacteria bacterium]|nr:UDP-glucose/GDP-mannose dehydrogenase family protein [Gammaproteobacteria bacterium]